MVRYCRQLLASIVLATLTPALLPAAEPAELLRQFGQAQLLFVTEHRNCVLISVYVARTAEQRSQGLMHIRKLEPYEGMIFLYPEPAQISMWMKNTYIPLDMVFVSTRATVMQVHANAEPLSETIISSGASAAAVIELNGGEAERFGIRPGSGIIFPAG